MLNFLSSLQEQIEYSDDVPSVDAKLIKADYSASSIEAHIGDAVTYMYVIVQPDEYITAEEYPILAQLWDNDDDSVFDNM